jgi:hypothetical protein
MQIATIRRIVQLAQAIGARGRIGWDQGSLRAGHLTVANGERGIPEGGHIDTRDLIHARERRRRRKCCNQSGNVIRRSLDLKDDAAGVVSDEPPQPARCRLAPDEGPEANTLDEPRYQYPRADSSNPATAFFLGADLPT